MSAVHQVPLPPVRPQDGAKAGASVCAWLTLEPNPSRREQWAQCPGCPTPITPAPQGEALQVIQDSLGGSECSHGCSWRVQPCQRGPTPPSAPLQAATSEQGTTHGWGARAVPPKSHGMQASILGACCAPAPPHPARSSSSSRQASPRAQGGLQGPVPTTSDQPGET